MSVVCGRVFLPFFRVFSVASGCSSWEAAIIERVFVATCPIHAVSALVGGHVLSTGWSPVARVGRVQRVLIEELRVVLSNGVCCNEGDGRDAKVVRGEEGNRFKVIRQNQKPKEAISEDK